MTTDIIPPSVFRPYPSSEYGVTIWLHRVVHHIEAEAAVGFDKDPDFQRRHRWTDAQRVAWIEHVLRGGKTARSILVAHSGKRLFDSDINGHIPDYTLVDGKQRLYAAELFCRGELRVFAHPKKPEGYSLADLSPLRNHANITWDVVVLPDRAAIIDLYLRLNTAGCGHTEEEIAHAKACRDKLHGA